MSVPQNKLFPNKTALFIYFHYCIFIRIFIKTMCKEIIYYVVLFGGFKWAWGSARQNGGLLNDFFHEVLMQETTDFVNGGSVTNTHGGAMMQRGSVGGVTVCGRPINTNLKLTNLYPLTCSSM